MNKNIIKNAIILTAIIIIIIIIALVSILVVNKRDKEINGDTSMSSDAKEVQTFEGQVDKYDFLIVSNCITNYIDKLNKDNSAYYGYDENNNYTITVPEDTIKQNIYDLLSENYIQKNSITLDNIYNYVENINEHLMFVPVDMLASKEETVNTYLVYGYTINFEYNKVNDEYILVNIDTKNETFSIEPVNEEYYNNGVVEETLTSIEQNDNNKINSSSLTEEYRIQQYFQNYKFMLLSDPDTAYEFLNDEYKQKAFGNVENFKTFLNDNRDRILTTRLDEYEWNTEDNSTEFIERDENNKYYVFNISDTDATDYNVMLDNYVIGSKELQDTYNNANDERKVNINTMRFISAINDKNYYYAYNILADSFKNNNFPTITDFENYVKANLFENNTIDDASFSQENGYYTYDLTISDGNGQNKKMSIVMQLQEGTDFVMSFSLGE